MAFKLKNKLLITAMMSVASNQHFVSAETNMTDPISGKVEQRFIIKYKQPAKNIMNASADTGFDSTVIRQKLEQSGIEVKVELVTQRSIAVILTEQMVNDLRLDPTVESIERDLTRKFLAIYEDTTGNPNTIQLIPYAVAQSQAGELNLQGDQKVCVIDSGIAGSDGETGGLNDDFEWSNITGIDDSGTGSWYADGGPHGTHVAGTVGAADNAFGVIGMAPGVPMHIVKVFNNDGWGYSSDLAFAAEKCTEAGANIITMSLGGGGASSVEETAFDTFTDNGGLVLAAAGNDANDVRSYPAGYDSVMMIGANDGDNNIADFSQFPSCNTEQTDCVEVTAGGVNTLSTFPAGGATVAGLTADDIGYDATAMENTGDADGETYEMGIGDAIDAEADGKICVIDRGDVTFHDKTKNCEDSGGIGAIIVNNEAGIFSGTLGETNTTTIPVVGAAFENRDALIAASSASISVGPGNYGLMSGTSMATPGVAGVAALVWSNHPFCTGTEVRHALKTTAEDSGDAGHDIYFGNGIVKAKDASDYLAANGCAANPPTGSLQLEKSTEIVDENGGTVELIVNRINGSFGEVSFEISTSDGTTTSDSDYAALSQTITMADGETSKSISVEILDDSEYEGEVGETFYVTLLNPSVNASLSDPSEMEITINEDDPIPPAGDFVLSSAQYDIDENVTTLVIAVNRINGDFGEATVDISSSENSALSGVDFQALNQTVIFADGETSKEVSVSMIDDQVFEGDETFNLILANPSDRSNLDTPTSASVTINEDEPEPPAGEFNWAASSLTLDESFGSFELSINRENGNYGECIITATINHSSTDASDISGNISVDLVLADGETSGSVIFTISDDTEDESNESFNVILSSASRCKAGASNSISTTIIDNDESESGGGSIPMNWLLLLPLLTLGSKRSKPTKR